MLEGLQGFAHLTWRERVLLGAGAVSAKAGLWKQRMDGYVWGMVRRQVWGEQKLQRTLQWLAGRLGRGVLPTSDSRFLLPPIPPPRAPVLEGSCPHPGPRVLQQKPTPGSKQAQAMHSL